MNNISDELTHDEQWVFYSLLTVQEQVLRERENGRISKDIYKWVHTRKVANYMEQQLSWVRYRLNKLVDKGLVEVVRRSNNCNWSCTSIDGYKEGRYKDYLVRAEK